MSDKDTFGIPVPCYTDLRSRMLDNERSYTEARNKRWNAAVENLLTTEEAEAEARAFLDSLKVKYHEIAARWKSLKT